MMTPDRDITRTVWSCSFCGGRTVPHSSTYIDGKLLRVRQCMSCRRYITVDPDTVGAEPCLDPWRPFDAP